MRNLLTLIKCKSELQEGESVSSVVLIYKKPQVDGAVVLAHQRPADVSDAPLRQRRRRSDDRASSRSLICDLRLEPLMTRCNQPAEREGDVLLLLTPGLCWEGPSRRARA